MRANNEHGTQGEDDLLVNFDNNRYMFYENILAQVKSNNIKHIKFNVLKTPDVLTKKKTFQQSSNICGHAIFPNGIVATGDNRKMKLWDMEQGTCIKTVQFPTNIRDIVPISNSLCAVNRNLKEIEIWDINREVCVKTLAGHSNWLQFIKVLPNGLLASADDNTLRLWDVERGVCVKTLSDQRVNTVLGLPNNILAVGDSKGWKYTIKLYDISHGWKITCLKTLTGHSSHVYSFALLPNNILASGSDDGTIKLWDISDIKNASCVSTLVVNSKFVRSLTPLSNNLLVSISSYENILKIWDMATGICLQTILSSDGFSWTASANGCVVRRKYTVLKCGEMMYRSINTEETHNLLKVLQQNNSVEEVDFENIVLSAEQIATLATLLSNTENKMQVFNLQVNIINNFTPLVKFIGNERVFFKVEANIIGVIDGEGNNILHHLVRLYKSRPKEIRGLILECLSINGEDMVIAQNKAGKTPIGMAREQNNAKLFKLLQENRPPFNLATVVLDWCQDNKGWQDVKAIDGSTVSMRSVRETILETKKTPSKTRVLSMEFLETGKRDLSQMRTIVKITDNDITLKMNQTVGVNNKVLRIHSKSNEQASSNRHQISNSSSNESSQVDTSTNSTEDRTSHREVETSGWSVKAGASASFFGIGFSASAEASGSSQQVDEHSNTRRSSHSQQNTQRQTQAHQTTDTNEQSRRSSELNRQEQERQQQFSLANGKQQSKRIRTEEKNTSQSAFEKGYFLISTTEQTTGKSYNTFIMDFELSGTVKIKRDSRGKNAVIISMGDILRDRRNMLEQVYGDYQWNFDEEDSVKCSISGSYVIHESVTRDGITEHPLHRIKRLLQTLVNRENEIRRARNKTAKTNPQTFWLVDIRVHPDKLNPIKGSIEIRCKASTDTQYLHDILKTLVDFSTLESMIEESLPNNFIRFTLTFLGREEFAANTIGEGSTHNTNLPQTRSQPRAGLLRVNSGHFPAFFFDKRNEVMLKIKKQNQAAQITQKIIMTCFPEGTPRTEIPRVEIEGTTLRIYFRPRQSTFNFKAKVRLNSLRLALANFFEQVDEDALPSPKPVSGVRGLYACTIDFAAVKMDQISALCNPNQHKALMENFQNLYKSYYGRLESVEPSALKETTKQLYDDLKTRLEQTEEETVVFDF